MRSQHSQLAQIIKDMSNKISLTNNNKDFTNQIEAIILRLLHIFHLLPFLPKDVLLLIYAHLVLDEKNATQQQIKNASCLARLSNKENYFTHFRPKLLNLGAAKLLKHVLYTEVKQVVQMVNSNPELFFIKTEGMDDANRSIQGSPFQSVIATGDPRLMALAKKVIEGSTDLCQLAFVQFNEQFPASYNEEEEVKKHDAIFASVVKAINADPCTYGKPTLPATLIAIKEFQDYFTPKSTDIIKTGKHFSQLIVKKALDVYNEIQDIGINCPYKSIVYSCQIYGFLLTILTNRDKCVVKKGIANVVDKHQEADENFNLQEYLKSLDGDGVISLDGKETRLIFSGTELHWNNYIKQTDHTLLNLRDSCKANNLTSVSAGKLESQFGNKA